MSVRYREPRGIDYLLFFFGIPIALGIIFSLVGTRLTYDMPYFDSLVYMVIHMFVAWWSVNIGALIINYSFKSWQPPAIVVCCIGMFIALAPAAFAFQVLGDYFGKIYPVYAANRFDLVQPAWSLEYLVHFVRYSLPVVPTFLVGVFGYRAVTGVNWYGFQKSEPLSMAPAPNAVRRQPTAALIDNSKLPPDAVLISIKAEQHYISIQSDQGSDFVRYRFSDLEELLKNCEGIQTHRSWWVNPAFVKDYLVDGRKMSLVIDDKLTVPVSQPYRQAVIQALETR
ncbi:MAG: LytTR family DNA-binding domain-containing protein [Gammaproteobacteria bacterium]